MGHLRCPPQAWCSRVAAQRGQSLWEGEQQYQHWEVAGRRGKGVGPQSRGVAG